MAEEKNTLNLVMNRPGTSLSPFVYTTLHEWYIHSNITTTLVTVDRENQIRSNLAYKWDVSEGGKTYTFYLKTDTHWSDGKIISPADVYETFSSKKRQNSAKYFDHILDNSSRSSISLNGNKLTFYLKKPDEKFLYHLTRAEFGIVHWESFTETSNYTEKIPTSGRYKIYSIDESKIVLAPNPYAVTLDDQPQKIIFKYHEDKMSVRNLIREGRGGFFEIEDQFDIDLALSSGHYSVVNGGFDNLMTLQSRNLKGKRLEAFKVLGRYLNKANLISSDEEAISERLAAYTIIPDQLIMNKKLTKIEAASLLKGEKYKLVLTLGAESSSRQLLNAEAIRVQAGEIGIELEINVLAQNFKRQWENEQYEISVTVMGVYGEDEAELFYGYLCAGYKPYSALRGISCDDFQKASKYLESSMERKEALVIAYRKLLQSGRMFPLYFFPRKFLVHNDWTIQDHNYLLPYPFFWNFKKI